jgi:hypothetical protein
MTLRRLTIAMTVVCGLCVWGFAHSGEAPSIPDPVRVADGEGASHDEALARYRTNQSRHWRHVAIGNHSGTP